MQQNFLFLLENTRMVSEIYHLMPKKLHQNDPVFLTCNKQVSLILNSQDTKVLFKFT